MFIFEKSISRCLALVPAFVFAFMDVSMAQNNNWQRQQQQQQQANQQRQQQQLDNQRQQQRAQQQDAARQQVRERQQQETRAAMQANIRSQESQRIRNDTTQRLRTEQSSKVREQVRNDAANTARQNYRDQASQAGKRGTVQSASTTNRSDKVVFSNGVAKLTRPLTPGEAKRGFTGKLTGDGRALVKFQGRVFAVPAARVGIKVPRTETSGAALTTSWSPQKQASISGEIQKLALAGGVARTVKSGVTPTFNVAAVQKRISRARDERTASINNIQRGDSVAANRSYVTEKALAEGWSPPHSEGSALRKFVTADTIKFVRVHVDKDNPQGGFLIRAKEIEHLNGDPEKIKHYLGLKDRPNFISDVDVPPNTAMEVSVIGPQKNFGLDKTSGFQYILKEDIPKESFKNTRPLQ